MITYTCVIQCVLNEQRSQEQMGCHLISSSGVGGEIIALCVCAIDSLRGDGTPGGLDPQALLLHMHGSSQTC